MVPLRTATGKKKRAPEGARPNTTSLLLDQKFWITPSAKIFGSAPAPIGLAEVSPAAV